MNEKRSLAGRDWRTEPTVQVGTNGTTRKDQESKLREQQRGTGGRTQALEPSRARFKSWLHLNASQVALGWRWWRWRKQQLQWAITYWQYQVQPLGNKHLCTYEITYVISFSFHSNPVNTILSLFSRSGERRLKRLIACPRSTARWDSNPGLLDSQPRLLISKLHCTAKPQLPRLWKG